MAVKGGRMVTPTGKECPHYYEDFNRGRAIQECRLAAQNAESLHWRPRDCAKCAVPDILRANASPNLELRLTIRGAARLCAPGARGCWCPHDIPIADPYTGCRWTRRRMTRCAFPRGAGRGGGVGGSRALSPLMWSVTPCREPPAAGADHGQQAGAAHELKVDGTPDTSAQLGFEPGFLAFVKLRVRHSELLSSCVWLPASQAVSYFTLSCVLLCRVRLGARR